MKLRSRRDQASAISRRDRSQNAYVAVGVVATAVLTYGLGRELAKATQYAEDLEEDQFCGSQHAEAVARAEAATRNAGPAARTRG